MKRIFVFSLICMGLGYEPAVAVEHYVDASSTTPTAPYTNWMTAATNIQSAVDAAAGGDTIWVTNGNYFSTDQILITNSVSIQSVNGPDETIVDAPQNDRCFLLSGSSKVFSITGFTVRNGYTTGSGGGIYCSSTNSSVFITNCIISGNSAADSGGGVYSKSLLVLIDCVVTGNTATNGYGGGVYEGICYNSTVSSNSALFGGGLAYGSATNCILEENTALSVGGGAFNATLNRCKVLSNEAVYQGGGVYAGSADSCLIINNRQYLQDTDGITTCGGGGTFGTTNRNCTICGNTASDYGGGVHGGFPVGSGIIYNSIIYYNDGYSSYDDAYDITGYASCSTGLSSGNDNISSAPQFVDRANDNYWLATNSPCIDSGLDAYVVSSIDLNGFPRIIDRVDIGAYEYTHGPLIETSVQFFSISVPVGTDSNHTDFTVRNIGSSNLIYEISTSVPWLSVSPTNGSSTGEVDTISLSMELSSLNFGTYEGDITITANSPANSPHLIPVSLTILPASLQLSTNWIIVQASLGESPQDQTFAVHNSGGTGVMNYVVSDNADWLSVSPTNGVSVGETNTVTISYDTASLSVGSYTGTISVASSEADNSPQVVQVQLDIQPHVIYVSATNGNDSANGYTWGEAKATIQAGVDALEISGGTVIVSNGTYNLSNEIFINKSLTLQSVNGPDKTIIDSRWLCRCLNLGSSSTIVSGFTLKNGFADGDNSSPPIPGEVSNGGNGGAVYCDNSTPILTNCVISDSIANGTGGGVIYGTLKNCDVINNGSLASNGGGLYRSTVEGCLIEGNYVTGTNSNGGGLYDGTALNSVFRENSAAMGGGMYGGTASGCLFETNSASSSGGGTYNCNVKNCTIVRNNAVNAGGGMYGGDSRNSIIYDNTPDNLNMEGTVFFSCSPDLTHGTFANITNEPIFVDYATGDFRLGFSSPCIDKGGDNSGLWSFDLIGNPRIYNTYVDMGAYEYVSSMVDTDGDTMSDADELVGGTDPRDASSVLRILGLLKISSGMQLGWQGGSNVTQYVDAASNLTLDEWSTIYTNLPPTAITNELIDTDATNQVRFYRIRVGGGSL